MTSSEIPLARLNGILILLALTAVAAFGQGVAQPRGAPKPKPAPFMLEAASHEESQRVTKTVFKNGLTVLVYESHAQPLVSIRTYVYGGFLDDPDEMTGLSALTARMRETVGEGSPAGSIRGRAHALGGVFNSRAGPRYSRFELTVPAARWKQAINIQADAMLTPFENNEAFRIHAARIAENMRDASAPDDAIARAELRVLAFGERRFAETGVSVKISPERIIEFHKNRYVPSAMTLVAAGDVRAEDILNEIARVFGSRNENAKNGDVRAAAPPLGKSLAPAGEFRYRAAAGDIAFPKVFFGFPVPAENSEDYRALEVVATILGIGETSVLNARLRDRKNLIFTADAQMESFDGAGFFSVGLETEPQNIDRTEIAFWTEVEILKRDGPSEAELARAAAQLERLWWQRREIVDELADTLAGFEFNGGWKRMDGYIAEIRKVTAADVKRAVARYITLSNCALLERLPRSSAERNPAASAVRVTLESLLKPAVNEELNARMGEVEIGFKIPPVGAAFRMSEVKHSFQAASILRGPEVYIREDHTSPLVQMGVFFTGGKALENEEDAGITGLMLELMLRNERENRQLEIYGGRLTPVVADDYFGFFLSIPARNISGGFDRIKLAIKSPVFDKAVTPVSLKKISVETVRDWYEENVRNVKPFVTIIGDTEGSSLASWFVGEFSGSRMRDGKKAVSSPKPVEKTETLNFNADAGRSAILLGFQAPPAGDIDAYGIFVLKEYLESRLRETTGISEKNKEREAADRRIDCKYRPLLSGGSFVISATVNARDETQSAEILRKEIARLIDQPLSYADFHASRALAAGSYMAGNQTRRAQIENLTKSLLAGRSLEEHHNFSQNMEQIGEEDFKELMRRVLDINKSVTLIVHGGDK
jgi:zinc protease